MFKFIKNAISIRNTNAELERLTNRELADIGITRSEIRNIAKRAIAENF